jgi:hypothetical protein
MLWIAGACRCLFLDWQGIILNEAVDSGNLAFRKNSAVRNSEVRYSLTFGFCGPVSVGPFLRE